MVGVGVVEDVGGFGWSLGDSRMTPREGNI